MPDSRDDWSLLQPDALSRADLIRFRGREALRAATLHAGSLGLGVIAGRLAVGLVLQSPRYGRRYPLEPVDDHGLTAGPSSPRLARKAITASGPAVAAHDRPEPAAALSCTAGGHPRPQG